MKLKSALFACTLAGSILAAGTSQAQDVDVMLLLLQDVSGSISNAEFALQRDGYAAAFNDPAIKGLFAGGGLSVAVSLVYWSTDEFVPPAVPWFVIDSPADSSTFASLIAATSRPGNGSTGIAGALTYGAGYISDNIALYTPEKTIIDIASDGVENVAGPANSAAANNAVKAARDAALAGDVDVINALAIQSNSLVTYYTNHVIGGDDAFVAFANDFDVFKEAITEKIRQEIIVPEPSTVAFFGLGGIVALVALRRRRA